MMENNVLSPKDEAKELIDAFTYNCHECNSLENAKQSALITVKKILGIKSVDKDYDLSTYWEEVEQEIKHYEQQ